MKCFTIVAAGLAISMACSQGAAAASDIKVFSTIGVQGAVEELVPKYEKNSGNKLNIIWATAAMLVKRLQEGETADVMILSVAGLDTMTKEGRILPGSQVKLAGSGVAIAIKAGTPKPDISMPEALKATLLNAKSISYTDPSAGGASGIYFANLLEKMGIAKDINAKTIYPPAGGFAGNLLLTGQVDIAIQQRPELMTVSGIEIIGELPGDLNMVTEFAAGVWVKSENAAAAVTLLEFLHSPEAAAVYKARGLTPL